MKDEQDYCFLCQKRSNKKSTSVIFAVLILEHSYSQWQCHVGFLGSNQTLQLSNIGPGQCLDERPLGNSSCCWHGFGYQGCLESSKQHQSVPLLVVVKAQVSILGRPNSKHCQGTKIIFFRSYLLLFNKYMCFIIRNIYMHMYIILS